MAKPASSQLLLPEDKVDLFPGDPRPCLPHCLPSGSSRTSSWGKKEMGGGEKRRRQGLSTMRKGPRARERGRHQPPGKAGNGFLPEPPERNTACCTLTFALGDPLPWET